MYKDKILKDMSNLGKTNPKQYWGLLEKLRKESRTDEGNNGIDAETIG